jgi:uncharacterized protein
MQPDTLAQKKAALIRRLHELPGLLVAYSGGIDSAYLAWSAAKALGDRMLAVIADSASLPRRHLIAAQDFAEKHGIPYKAVFTAELDNPDYVKNDSLRCFHCKSELFAVMERMRTQLGFSFLAYGLNLDDRQDFRPGQQAAQNRDVLAPLVEVGLNKSEIRALAREDGLEVWDKPAAACLSSRIAYGQPVTTNTLNRIEKAEEFLESQGCREFRVRSHGDLARVEIARSEMAHFLRDPGFLQRLSEALKACGFMYVTLDCDGFRSGSMNAALTQANT